MYYVFKGLSMFPAKFFIYSAFKTVYDKQFHAFKLKCKTCYGPLALVVNPVMVGLPSSSSSLNGFTSVLDIQPICHHIPPPLSLLFHPCSAPSAHLISSFIPFLHLSSSSTPPALHAILNSLSSLYLLCSSSRHFHLSIFSLGN